MDENGVFELIAYYLTTKGLTIEFVGFNIMWDGESKKISTRVKLSGSNARWK